MKIIPNLHNCNHSHNLRLKVYLVVSLVMSYVKKIISVNTFYHGNQTASFRIFKKMQKIRIFIIYYLLWTEGLVNEACLYPFKKSVWQKWKFSDFKTEIKGVLWCSCYHSNQSQYMRSFIIFMTFPSKCNIWTIWTPILQLSINHPLHDS
jgi:hypothetical protein